MVATVVHTASVVDQTETRLVAKVGLLKFCVMRVLGEQLVNQRFVRCLRKPALLINQGQNTHRLQQTRARKQQDFKA